MLNKAILEGRIDGWKSVIEINESCGAYNTCPARKERELGYLEGLEYALEIMSKSDDEIREIINKNIEEI